MKGKRVPSQLHERCIGRKETYGLQDTTGLDGY
jgi:hypothetical protein